jgi:hypothetical protein
MQLLQSQLQGSTMANMMKHANGHNPAQQEDQEAERIEQVSNHKRQ